MIPYLQALQPYLLPGFVAFALTFVLTAFSLYVFPRLGLLDKPKKYGLKRAPIPYSGGLIIFAVFLICLGIFMDFDKHLWGVVIAATMIVTVSFLDDRIGLSPILRLGVQLVVLAGVGIASVTNPFGGLIYLDTYEIPIAIGDMVYNFTILADLFTILWIILLMNTLNWMDGVPGIVSGLTAIGSVVMFILAIRPNFHYIDQADVALLAVILAGCALAFWLFDFTPAKILMGDTGSMFLGFMLATLAIFSGGKIATALLIIGFPILDALWVIGRRLYQRKSPFRGDLRHIHHRLMKAGFSERQAVFFIYTVSVIFGGTALFLGSAQKMVALSVMLVLMVILGGLVVMKGRTNKT